MKIYGMKTNHLVNPIGFELSPVTLSYKVMGEKGETAQKAARIRVYGPGESVLFDSGFQKKLNPLCFTPELSLSPRTLYQWDVAVRSDAGTERLSSRAFFETGKGEEPWIAQWIKAPSKIQNASLSRRFCINQKVLAARLYICGLGLYEAYLGGEKIGDEYLTPGCTDYSARLQYQTYDVTNMLSTDNELTVLLGDGWYKGRFGFRGQSEIYGDHQALIAELHIAFEDGTKTLIKTDDGWRATESPVIFSNIYDGEEFDATFVSSAKEAALIDPQIGYERLSERLSPPVRVGETLRPIALLNTPAGETVLDMGQNMTGFLTFRDCGAAGDRMTLEFGEILQEGCFYRDNLRTAKQRFRYISDGRGEWVRPHFTFFGFRYVKLTGFDEPELYDFVGSVLYSAMDRTMFVKTSNEKVNRLAENALWGQRGNFVDVPTDCPQRDERMGWTGDAQAFCATALYQMDGAAFYTKFMRDMLSEQKKRGGATPHVIPAFEMPGSPSCAWADAATIIPWTLYLFYGDSALLQKQYENMKLWVEWILRTDEATGGGHLWRAGFHFADWLALDAEFPASCTGGTEPDFIASCFYLYSVRLTAKAAQVLRQEEDRKKYKALAEKILKAIRREYFSASGRLGVTTQTAYVLALFLGLCGKKEAPALRAALDRKLEDSRGELRTGFVGTAYLCRVLSENGMNPRAYSLFLREDYPSWLYEVNMGATTVWERWNSVLPDGRISDTGMNSLNHYAYGAVMEWLYRDAAGLSPMEKAPGFRRVRLTPRPDVRLPQISMRYESASGTYAVEITVQNEREYHLHIAVPFGCEAEIALPKAVAAGGGVWKTKNGGIEGTLKAGEYDIAVSLAEPMLEQSLLDTPFAELFKNQRMKALIKSRAPDIERVFTDKNPEKLTFRALRAYPFSPVPPEQIKALEAAMYELQFGGAAQK